MRAGSLFNSDLFFDWRLWLGVALSIVAVSALCWVPFIRGLTHSVAQMDRVTQQIAEGRFDVQVAHHRRDELGHLGEQINRLAARLQSFVKTRSVFWAISRTNSAPPSPASNSRSGFWSRKQPRPISRTWPCSTKRFWRCRAW